MGTYHTFPTTTEDSFVQHFLSHKLTKRPEITNLNSYNNRRVCNKIPIRLCVCAPYHVVTMGVWKFGTVFTSSLHERLKRFRFSFIFIGACVKRAG